MCTRFANNYIHKCRKEVREKRCGRAQLMHGMIEDGVAMVFSLNCSASTKSCCLKCRFIICVVVMCLERHFHVLHLWSIKPTITYRAQVCTFYVKGRSLYVLSALSLHVWPYKSACRLPCRGIHAFHTCLDTIASSDPLPFGIKISPSVWHKISPKSRWKPYWYLHTFLWV